MIRDGLQQRIAGRDVVRGDVVLVAEGDRIPADAILLHGINLSVDESLLTGESVPVRKAAANGPPAMAPPGGDDLPCLYSGTLVTAGQGVAEVQQTGLRTELGKIGKAIHAIEPEQTLLQKETGRLVRYLAIVGLALCAIVVVAYGLSRGNTRGSWEEGVLAGITMAMATLPEELPKHVATMAGRGLRVLAVASALVLLQDDFASIVAAVKMGRRIFDNIKKAVSYIFAVHVPIAGLSMAPVFFGDWPLLLLPIHVVFLELIIDPACSVIFEAENAEPNTTNRPPRPPTERLFSLRSVALSLLQGASVLGVLLAVFWVARLLGHSDDGARRALVFATLVVANLGLILTNRSWSRTIISMFKEPNAALWWVVGGAAAMLTTVLSVSFLRDLFHFNRLHPADVMLCVAGGIVSIVWFELLKLLKVRLA